MVMIDISYSYISNIYKIYAKQNARDYVARY